MSRHTTKTPTTMIFHGWLALSPNGDLKLTRTEPGLNAGDRALKLNVEVPRSLFRIPSLKADITVSGDGTDNGIIAADIACDAEKVLKEHFGTELSITVQEVNEVADGEG